MRAFVVFVVGIMLSTALPAQTTERPAPFDSAHRVLSVTPAIADRLRLAAPLWPVRGTYRDARLYAVEPGDAFVLVVQRLDGALDRFVLTPAQRATLGSAVDAGMTASGRPSAELAADIVSEPAGNAFARRQTLLAAAIYGPLAASLVTGQQSGGVIGAVYLIVTGGTFFASYGAAQSNQFTRAQSDLAGDLGLSAAAGGWLLGYSLSGNSNEGTRGISLASAVVGTVAGASLGASLSDAEAHAATMGIEAAAATGLAVASIGGASNRATAGVVVLAGGLGYPLGVRYPRRASYNVTAGDVEATTTAALVGGLYGGIFLGDHPSNRSVFAVSASSYLLGMIAGDRWFARPFDLTQAQANVLNIGAGAGALLGLAIPVLAETDRRVSFAGAAIGASLGMAALSASLPSSASAGSLRLGSRDTMRPRSPARFTLSGLSALAALAGVRGSHPLASFVF